MYYIVENTKYINNSKYELQVILLNIIALIYLFKYERAITVAPQILFIFNLY